MSAAIEARYKLVFFTPPAHLSSILQAVFATGAGRYPGPGSYTEVAWTSSPGVGQFRPGPSANPAIGTIGEMEMVEEVRCEVLCVGTDVCKAAVREVKRIHPYEEPAYEVYRMEDF